MSDTGSKNLMCRLHSPNGTHPFTATTTQNFSLPAATDTTSLRSTRMEQSTRCYFSGRMPLNGMATLTCRNLTAIVRQPNRSMAWVTSHTHADPVLDFGVGITLAFKKPFTLTAHLTTIAITTRDGPSSLHCHGPVWRSSPGVTAGRCLLKKAIHGEWISPDSILTKIPPHQKTPADGHGARTAYGTPTCQSVLP